MFQIALDSIHISINFSCFKSCLSIYLNIVLYYQAYYQRIILICQKLKLIFLFANLLLYEVISKLVYYQIIHLKRQFLCVVRFKPSL